MSTKRPEIELCSEKNEQCWWCKTDLFKVKHTFNLTGVKNADRKPVNEYVLYCKSCQRYFATKEICSSLVKKYPGYYLKVSSRSANKHTTSKSVIQTATEQFETNKQSHAKNDQYDQIKTQEDEIPKGITVPVILSDTYGVNHGICPQCNSTMNTQSMNIPVLLENGDFYRYYLGPVLFCSHCQCGYITRKTADTILRRIQSDSAKKATIKLKNVRVDYDEKSDQYLYQPTLDNKSAIYLPGQDWTPREIQNTDTIPFREVSFLGKMGYSVDRPDNIRRAILVKAVREYGKRKVSDHLSFLIETRKKQYDGEEKYSHAISIWQSDKNYITSQKV